MERACESAQNDTHHEFAGPCAKALPAFEMVEAKRKGKEKTMAQIVSIKKMLENGVHFGHQTRRWNPKMKPYIYTSRNGVYIVDLNKTQEQIEDAYNALKEISENGGKVLFVGTKKQAADTIEEQALRSGSFYVNKRWLGGLLTNFQTVQKRLNRLRELDMVDFDDTSSGYTKKELLIQRRERDKLEKTLGGIRNMSRTPSAIWIVDTNKEHLAVDEAKKLGIPVVAILDTNCDPDDVDYPIPGNDDAIRSVALLTRIVADAAAEGLMKRHQKDGATGEAAEPMAEWELELLKQGEAAQEPATETPETETATEAAAAADETK